jgi:hypothetical protein
MKKGLKRFLIASLIITGLLVILLMVVGYLVGRSTLY